MIYTQLFFLNVYKNTKDTYYTYNKILILLNSVFTKFFGDREH